jgi:hypothetical protein
MGGTVNGEEKRPRIEMGRLREVHARQLGTRFAFGAGISIVAELIGLRFGTRLGGAFLAFPAILPASLTLIQREGGRRLASVDARGATLGAVGMVAFAITALLLMPRLSVVLGLLAAALAWLTLANVLYAMWPSARAG